VSWNEVGGRTRIRGRGYGKNEGVRGKKVDGAKCSGVDLFKGKETHGARREFRCKSNGPLTDVRVRLHRIQGQAKGTRGVKYLDNQREADKPLKEEKPLRVAKRSAPR